MFFLTLIHKNDIRLMEHNDQTFRKQVAGWINSYENPDAVEYLHNFINNSQASEETKLQLHKQCDRRIAELKHLPLFVSAQDGNYLADKNGDIKLFSNRLSAVWTAIGLGWKGYDVDIINGALHRIKLQETQTVNVKILFA